MNQERGRDGQEGADIEAPGEIDDIRVKQDGYRSVVFGQIADGLIPPHPGPPEATDDELSVAAMSDPAASEAEDRQSQPTIWRVVFLLVLITVALAIVFWK
ncbi:MAG: hypothetical protein LBQ86_02355 [Holophagales bacterium]|jgi:hypothetical protein|nr:hypothetical protein [Holophagales bacterium]